MDYVRHFGQQVAAFEAAEREAVSSHAASALAGLRSGVSYLATVAFPSGRRVVAPFSALVSLRWLVTGWRPAHHTISQPCVLKVLKMAAHHHDDKSTGPAKNRTESHGDRRPHGELHILIRN